MNKNPVLPTKRYEKITILPTYCRCPLLINQSSVTETKRDNTPKE